MSRRSLHSSVTWMGVAGCCLLLMSAALFIYLGSALRGAPTPSPSPSPEFTPEKSWTQWEDPNSPELNNAYYIRHLDEEKRALCNGLYQGIVSFAPEIEFPEPIHKDLLSELMWLIKYDCPELFHVNGEYTYYVRQEDPDMVIYMSLSYRMTQSEYEEALAATEAVIAGFKQATQGMDAFSIQKYIYDSIMQNCDYQEEGAHSGTAYGALVLGKARCEGYAQALNFALRMAGMDCAILTGEASESRIEGDDGTQDRSARHAWNVAEIGGQFYQLDATWDDSDGLLECSTAYAYFNVTDDEMGRSRSLDAIYEKLAVPSCTSMSYNYFVQTGTYIDMNRSVKDAFFAMLDKMRDEQTGVILGKLATSGQFDELNGNLREWISQWGGDNNYASGSYNLTMYPDSRVFCLTEIVFN